MASVGVYLEDYLDTVESLPTELIRNFTLMKELDYNSQKINNTLRTDTRSFLDTAEKLAEEERSAKIVEITGILKEYLKHGEDKVALAIQTYELVDRHIRRLDEDLLKYEEEQMTGPKIASAANKDDRHKAAERHSNSIGGSSQSKNNDGKRLAERKTKDRGDKPSIIEPIKDMTPRKDKNGKTASVPPPKVPANSKKGDKKKGGEASKVSAAVQLKPATQELPIDPNEPRYCICNQVSFGEMIGIVVPYY
ncbi:Inhibitor of growth protein 5 [Phlyctochytrium planicorne]|nr:Inhibitor of growth protein 5 [Phlyctochytrium planicorne]